jgi:nuclear pore complex protein Nup133
LIRFWIGELIEEEYFQNKYLIYDFPRTVITLAQDLAEDTPASDPRWGENSQQKYSLGSSSSMQIIQQLREKNLAMNHFIEFLHATKLWEKLYAVTDAGTVKPTGQVSYLPIFPRKLWLPFL